MLVFIVPLRSSQTANSWELVSKLFERCMKSLCNQTSPKFRIIVVCHERPITVLNHPHITYIDVDFPIPTWEKDSDIYSRIRDQARKVWTGLKYAQEFQPSHVMVVDADDLVNNNLASFVAENPQRNGWCIDRGYEYREGSNYIYRISNKFYDKCGTSYIVRYDLLDKYRNFQFEDVKGFDFLHHQSVPHQMLENGSPLEKLAFEGAVYCIDNGENTWIPSRSFFSIADRANLKELLLSLTRRTVKILLSQKLTEEIRERFGIYDLM